MNPLQDKQIKKLKELGCEDLNRKIQEIIDTLNESLVEVEDRIAHKKTGHQFKSKHFPPNITISIG